MLDKRAPIAARGDDPIKPSGAIAGSGTDRQARWSTVRDRLVRSFLSFAVVGLVTGPWRRRSSLRAAEDARDRALAALRRSEGRGRALAAASNARFVFVVVPTPPGGRAVPTIRPIAGPPPPGLRGRRWLDAVHPRDREVTLRLWATALASRRPRKIAHRLRGRDGAYRWHVTRVVPVIGEEGRVREWLAASTDVDARRRAEERSRHAALHDGLTGLPNRALFRDRLELALARARRRRHKAALLLVNLDRFKDVNDAFGHVAGDGLLREAARRLTGCTRASDTVAHLGGDEFALVLEGLCGADGAEAVARKTGDALAAPYALGGHEAHIGAGVGIALAPDDADDADLLLRRAGLALVRAKEVGRGAHAFYDPAMGARVEARAALERDLRRALDRGDELALHYQPEFDVGDGRIRGAEALMRWRHPARGRVPPAEFIPVAERSGLITPLGALALRAACGDARAWATGGLPPITVAVNVSLAQCRRGDLAATVEAILRESGLEPSALELEVTESLFLREEDDPTIAGLRRLRRAGVRVAVDDFGTGYSSLGRLRSLPVDKVKIDRSFVAGLGRDADAEASVRAAVALARALGLRTTAEGVENAEQLAFLRAIGCDGVQGFLLARPEPGEALAARLRAAARDVPA